MILIMLHASCFMLRASCLVHMHACMVHVLAWPLKMNFFWLDAHMTPVWAAAINYHLLLSLFFKFKQTESCYTTACM